MVWKPVTAVNRRKCLVEAVKRHFGFLVDVQNKQSAWTWQQAIWQFPAVTKVLRHHVAPHGTLQSLHVESLTL